MEPSAHTTHDGTRNDHSLRQGASSAEPRKLSPSFQQQHNPTKFFTFGKLIRAQLPRPSGVSSDKPWTVKGTLDNLICDKPGKALRASCGVEAHVLVRGVAAASTDYDDYFYASMGRAIDVDSDTGSEITRDTRYNRPVFSKRRRFIVVQVSPDHFSAVPITRYQGRSSSGRDTKHTRIAIVHTGSSNDTPSITNVAVSQTVPLAIKAKPDEEGAGLSRQTRLVLSKVYTMEYSVKVRSWGMIEPEHLPNLLLRVREAWAKQTTDKPLSGSLQRVTTEPSKFLPASVPPPRIAAAQTTSEIEWSSNIRNALDPDRSVSNARDLSALGSQLHLGSADGARRLEMPRARDIGPAFRKAPRFPGVYSAAQVGVPSRRLVDHTPPTQTQPMSYASGPTFSSYSPARAMPLPQSSAIYPYYDQRQCLHYAYDSERDLILYENGRCMPRVTQIPRSTLGVPATPSPADQDYRGGPPQRVPAYTAYPRETFTSAVQQRRAPDYGNRDSSQQPRPHPDLRPQMSLFTSATNDVRGPRRSPPGEQVRATLAQLASSDHSSIRASLSPSSGFLNSRHSSAVSEPRILSSTSPATGVRITSASEPKQVITDPALFAHNIEAHQILYGTTGEQETLFTSFRIVQQPERFFVVGRAFSILWSEPAGESSTEVTSMVSNDVAPNQSSFTTGRYGTRVYSKVRRFVVVRAGAAYCTALPILTYGGMGVAKPGVVKSEHAIIFSGRQPLRPSPEELPTRGELPLQSQPIRLVLDERTERLDPMSRINCARVHTIEHNVKVKPLGMVHPASMEALTTQFFAVWLPIAPLVPQQGVIANKAAAPQAAAASTTSAKAARVNMKRLIQLEMQRGQTQTQSIQAVVQRYTALGHSKKGVEALVRAALSLPGPEVPVVLEAVATVAPEQSYGLGADVFRSGNIELSSAEQDGQA
ncbi:hypothetical protein LTR91_022869 [Friedmanniomyces endolithicus]|uniref:DUF6590 domain-containing protein n=1 Tax=Friedmanniomyces endolithicus TaxID=329885 RepID=A0AAN6H432_9PEZI|nr:hypothetical protein LTR59_012788 [Friedmanniomyces endolithicus]KAK0782117.1 hypothetical protein LTR38_013493 [Friedmanniomyces endolithicus]KAK0890036.1 hypothetical protein LTR57_025233 [Friedmanniomyces endolithicus]KAK0952360.1 hypothetical protein LTS01_024861 [Friedmanniomyces endolithicus]KAK0955428.1 hypothetical protein LTR91_022869 [Friedmanniomyces endolithicus]